MPIVNCKICNKEFYGKPNHIKLGYCKYCSRKCQGLAQKKGRLVKCFVCGNEVWRTPKELKCSKSGNFFCSKTCQTVWRNKFFSGDKHPNWKGGENQLYRRKLIESGHPKKCIVCGCNDLRVLATHHIDRNRKNNEISNLVWLCHNCHFLEHFYSNK